MSIRTIFRVKLNLTGVEKPISLTLPRGDLFPFAVYVPPGGSKNDKS